MLYREIFKILGYYLFVLAGIILIPFVLASYYEFNLDSASHPQPHSSLAFIKTFGVCLIIGFLCYLIGKKTKGQLFKREGIAVVVIIWILTPAITGLPFYFSGTLSNPYQAYFEAVSGLSTTGSTVMQAKKFDPISGKEIPIVVVVEDVNPTTYEFYGTISPVRDSETGEVIHEGVEAVGRALLFWRSFLNFLGGGGIVVLFIAILPTLGISGKLLFQSEMTGPIKDTLAPRIKEAALQLWIIYIALNVLETIVLLLTNDKMELFDAMTISFSTIATGGLSIKNASIGYYENAATEWVVMLFMMFGATNFTVYYFAIRGKFYRIFKPELILFLVLVIISSALSSWFLIGSKKVLLTGDSSQGVFSTIEAIRYGFFQVISSNSTTGFSTADYDTWPYAVQVIMLIMMYVGGMTGSTAGGIKIVRHYMLFRIAQFKVESLFRTDTVRKFKIGDTEVDSENAIMVLCYFLTMITVSVLGTLFYVLDGVDPQTSLGLVACMINGTGLSFRVAGPTESCAFMSNFSVVISCLLMILGRLEFFAVLAILVPAFWRQTS